MNNILEEITYCDGKMGDVAKALYTPAKLKLRARTYNGINENLNRRRRPVVERATFNIPSAFMAVDIPSGDEGGSGYSVIQSENLENATIENAQKKLKINNNQLEGIMTHVPIVENNEVSVEPVVEAPVQEENMVTPEIVQQDMEVPEIAPVDEVAVEEQPVVQPEIEPEVAITNEAEVAKQEEVVPVEQPVVDPLDAAREKVLNTQNINTNNEVQPAIDAVEKAEETDVFKDLEKATNEYAEVDQEFKKSVQALEEAQKTLESSKNDFEKIEENIEKTSAKIQERNEAIDSANKEKEEIEAQIREIEEKTKAKIRLVTDAKEKRTREKREKDVETSKVRDENKAYQDKIEERTKTASELEQQDKELEQEENKALDAKREAQDRYNSKLAVFEAITLPEGINLEDDMEEVASISKFPSFTNENDDYSQEDDYVYTYKKAA